jgi:hypothetical protein
MSLSLLCFKFYFLLSNHPASPPHALSSSPPSPFPIDLHGRVCEQHNNSECTTMAMVVHSPLRRVAVARVCTKDLRYLRESTIEAPGMLKHVALQKTNATMINPIGHPNAGNCRLLVPVNLNLHSSESQQSILLHHLPTHAVLLA